MTTESLSPASRIVIETSSRPPGERSTSISLTGGRGSRGAGGERARAWRDVGARDARRRSAGFERCAATKAAESCAPNGPVCAVVGAADRSDREAVIDRLAAGFRWRMGARRRSRRRVTGAGAETSGLRPLRAASCAAARAGLTRFVAVPAARGAIAPGPARCRSMERRPRMVSPPWPRPREVCGQSVFAALTRLGRKRRRPARTASIASDGSRHARGGAEVKSAFANQPPDAAALAPGATGAPLSSAPGAFAAAGASEDAWSAACEPSSIAEAARNANGKDARSAPSLSSECLADCPCEDSSCRDSSEGCGCSSAAEAPAFAAAPGIESSTAAKAKRSAGGWGDARGAGGAIGPEAGAAAGAVMASLHFVSARGSTCAGAQLALARSSARVRWAFSFAVALERRGLAY